MALFFFYPYLLPPTLYGLIVRLLVSGLVAKLGVPDSTSPFLEHSTNMETLFLQCLSERFYTRMNSKLGRKSTISFTARGIERRH